MGGPGQFPMAAIQNMNNPMQLMAALMAQTAMASTKPYIPPRPRPKQPFTGAQGQNIPRTDIPHAPQATAQNQQD